jgi:ppGpp synthetase/RelA/SpoT-type nucleotidyltranferase
MDLEAIRKRWIRDQPRHKDFVDHMIGELRAALRLGGIYGEISGRTKEVDSLLKKTLRKGYSIYEDITDKAGIRVVVRFLGDIEDVGSVVSRRFRILRREDKTSLLGASQVGYQGVHYDIKLLEASDGFGKFADLQAELQVRTLSQDVWSRISHELSYKSDLSMPREMERRLYCLSALLEVADQEFSRLDMEIRQLPNAEVLRVLSSLERQYYKLTSLQYDRELALQTIAALAPLYPGGVLDDSQTHFEGFCATNSRKLSKIFEEYGGISDHSPFLFQPEVLMIFDLLERNRYVLKDEWEKHFPVDELERLAVVWGTSLH